MKNETAKYQQEREALRETIKERARVEYVRRLRDKGPLWERAYIALARFLLEWFGRN